MKTIEQLVTMEMHCIDGRDLARLLEFIPTDRLEARGVTLKPEAIGKRVVLPLTRENVLEKLKLDLAFGFEKALDKRGISASLMADVIQMWNNVLEEGLTDTEFDYEANYANYGLPIFKATALKYGLPNEIGDDVGNEYKYSAEAD